MSRKNIIDRVLNRPSESRGSQPSGLLFGSFRTSKKNKPVSLSGTFRFTESSPMPDSTRHVLFFQRKARKRSRKAKDFSASFLLHSVYFQQVGRTGHVQRQTGRDDNRVAFRYNVRLLGTIDRMHKQLFFVILIQRQNRQYAP